MLHNKVNVIGYASDIAGAIPGGAEGPMQLKRSAFWPEINVQFDWQAMLQPDPSLPSTLRQVTKICQELSMLTVTSVIEKKFFTVFGGDHTAAVGTWSGVSYAKNADGPIGLIWIDAHLDSHTMETSETGNLHGMPLACLLGHGISELTHILNSKPKLKPENICLIGIRSYEQGEFDLLKKLNVRIFFMEEVQQKGLDAVMQEAIVHVNKNTSCYGITIDIDGIDPLDAPGTGVAEENGIRADDMCRALTLLANDSRLIGAEIVEFDPVHDKDHMTEKLVFRMLTAILTGKNI